MKTIVMIPTYNERANIEPLVNKILNLKINSLEILFVDDNSPDRTWKLIKDIGSRHKNVHLLLRKKERGRGLAGRAGFKKCLDMHADIIIEMDADLSHNPEYIPAMLKRINRADIIVGSRHTQGGLDTRSLLRKNVSKLAGLYLRTVLGIRIKDPTSGYRCFKKNVIAAIVDDLEARDPFIVIEILYKCIKKHYVIKEIPIIFSDRRYGKSKLEIGAMLKYIVRTIKLKAQ